MSMNDPILCCEEDICGGEAIKRLAVSLDNGHVHVLRQEMWRTSEVAAGMPCDCGHDEDADALARFDVVTGGGR